MKEIQNNNKALLPATTWINLRKRQKCYNCMISFTWRPRTGSTGRSQERWRPWGRSGTDWDRKPSRVLGMFQVLIRGVTQVYPCVKFYWIVYWQFVYLTVHAVQGGTQKTLEFIKNCGLILTCLNFRHLQSTLSPFDAIHLLRLFYPLLKSFWTRWFWCLLVLLLFFLFHLFHSGKTCPFENLFHRGNKKRNSPGARSGE